MSGVRPRKLVGPAHALRLSPASRQEPSATSPKPEHRAAGAASWMDTPKTSSAPQAASTPQAIGELADGGVSAVNLAREWTARGSASRQSGNNCEAAGPAHTVLSSSESSPERRRGSRQHHRRGRLTREANRASGEAVKHALANHRACGSAGPIPDQHPAQHRRAARPTSRSRITSTGGSCRTSATICRGLPVAREGYVECDDLGSLYAPNRITGAIVY